MALTPEELLECKRLHDEEGLSFTEIAIRFGTTKNAVARALHRAGYSEVKQPPYEHTTMGRLDAIHAKMDAVIAENKRPGIRAPAG